jgi:hypothetical protein
VPVYLPPRSTVEYLHVESVYQERFRTWMRPDELQVTLVIGNRAVPAEVAKSVARGLSAVSGVSAKIRQQPPQYESTQIVFSRAGLKHTGLVASVGMGPRVFDPDTLRLSRHGEETKMILVGWLQRPRPGGQHVQTDSSER